MSVLLPLLVVGAGCEDGTDLPRAIPVEVVVESGDAQSAQAGEALPQPVVASVHRQEDGGISRRPIWVQLVDDGSVKSGGASASGPGAGIGSSELSTISVEWTLSDEVGMQRLRFFTLELYGDTVEAFATAEALPPAAGR